MVPDRQEKRQCLAVDLLSQSNLNLPKFIVEVQLDDTWHSTNTLARVVQIPCHQAKNWALISVFNFSLVMENALVKLLNPTWHSVNEGPTLKWKSREVVWLTPMSASRPRFMVVVVSVDIFAPAQHGLT